MLMDVHSGLGARLLGQEELNRVRWWTAVVLAWEEDRDVHSEDILGAGEKAKDVLGEEAVALVQLQLVQRVEAILATTRIERVLRPASHPANTSNNRVVSDPVCM